MKTVSLYRPRILENALNDFDRYFNSFFGENLFTPSDRSAERLPAVDVRETENNYTIEAELPGYDEKDIQLRVDSNYLTIESNREENVKSGQNANYLVRERRVSSFSRSFMLPENADSESVTASFKNGILTMEIKKKVEAQKRIIEISKS